jgi:hypothetical protein
MMQLIRCLVFENKERALIKNAHILGTVGSGFVMQGNK